MLHVHMYILLRDHYCFTSFYDNYLWCMFSIGQWSMYHRLKDIFKKM